MAELTSEKRINQVEVHNLFMNYEWFYDNIYNNLQKSIYDFFQRNIEVRFMGISKGENILFYGDEYFVNKIPVTPLSDMKIKISSNLISSLLDVVLGKSETKFSLENLTNIEAQLIKSYTLFFYNSIENIVDKSETNKRVIQSSEEYDFTFYVRVNDIHSGKIILTIPEYMIPELPEVEYEDRFSIMDFKKVGVKLGISSGTSKITLNDVKSIEVGDIILLENSNINELTVLWNGKKIPFKINPNPSLIISIDKDGGNDMEEEINSKSQNMWDSILVDIVAEFDNVKLTLGELKQISEGLVIDVGSIYDNKIKIRVENQIVATGELVILNDRYGVRIDKVTKSNSKKSAPEAQNSEANDNQNTPQQKSKAPKNGEGDGNFDYSDFDIEDESI